MKNIAPEIVRQRLLIESYYNIEITREVIENFLLGMAAELNLRTYSEPIIFSPATGMGKDINEGFDAFVPLIDSGISIYIWTKARFLSLIVYTCKEFDNEKAIEFTRNFFKTDDNLVAEAF